MNEIKVLDHGFVRLRNLSGPTRRIVNTFGASNIGEENRSFDADDVDPANTARLSFDQGFATRPRDEDLRLCDYLMKNRHSTPFEMIECWIEMKLPIFVARQFVRHRTVTINEISARYVTLPAEWYVPAPENVGLRPKNMKQGRSQLAWNELNLQQQATIIGFCADLRQDCWTGYKAYHASIEAGIPPELARCFLHVNHYTHWLWKQDLHNIMHFLMLRVDSHAQYEAQEYGNAVLALLRQHLPESMALFDKYRRLP